MSLRGILQGLGKLISKKAKPSQATGQQQKLITYTPETKKLPATETGGATQYQANLGTDSPEYQHGKIYYNMEDSQFYMFSEAGPGFILITMTQE